MSEESVTKHHFVPMWEYLTVIRLWGDDWSKTLDYWGQSGWEVVAIDFKHDTAYVKRELPGVFDTWTGVNYND